MTKARKITFNGQTKSYLEWQRETGISAILIRYRIDAGWPADKALTVRPRTEMVASQPAKVSFALTNVLPALPALHDSNSRELDRMRRALRALIRRTERDAAAIGRRFAVSVASIIDEQHRGAVENFSKNARDRTHSVAQERS